MMKRLLVASALSIVLSHHQASAQGFDLDDVPPEVRPSYEAHAADIQDLTGKVLDASMQDDARAAALQQLQLRYPYLALPLANTVALKAGNALQATATRILVGSVVMMNHRTRDDHAMHARFNATMNTLKELIASGSSEARALAAQTGASLGQAEIISEIVNQSEKGVIADPEAVGYLTLADPEIAAPYVNKYLESESVAAQTQAISYLGPLPEYQDKIRDEYLLAEGKPTEVQAAAAKVLARTDSDFQSYATEVVERAGTPVEVLDAMIAGSLANTANPVNAAQVSRYSDLVDAYERGNPDVNMNAIGNIQRQLQDIQ